jgi:uncharacterized damage-inducible protein DinB
MDPELALLYDELERAWDGQPWHGSPVTEILAGIAAGQAAARPIPAAHSIWEIVLHMTSWTREVARRLRGSTPELPVEGDWPEVAEATEAAWTQAKDELAVAHGELLAAVASFPAERLAAIVGNPEVDPALGSGTSYAVMLHGLAQHHAYHAGQIAILRR